MKEYDLYLPLHHNDGRPIAEDKIEAFKRLLTNEFGGLTHFPQQNEGLWKFGGRTFRDRVVILRVLAEDPAHARVFFTRFKERLKAELGQAEILIVEREVQTLD